ncbi:hypothetical protein H4W32_004290 [Actinophytocola algeriensis]|nr:hypothetical protein [Actinophytocola algeriensis]
MPGEPDDAHVVAEVLAAELRADAELAGHLEDLLLEVGVPERVPASRALAGEVVEVAGGGELGDLERVLGGGAADDDREVVGRARGGAEAAELLVEELRQARRVQQGFRFLVQEGLVGAAAALGHEEELVLRLVAVLVVQLQLRGEVGAGVLLVPEVDGRELRVAEVQLLVGLEDALGERGLVGAAGEHVLGALADDDRGPGVLAHGEDAARGDARVAQQVHGDEPVVAAGLGVVDDGAQLGQVAGAQQVLDVPDGFLGQGGECFRGDLEELPARGFDERDPVGRDQSVFGAGVRSERKGFGVLEGRGHLGDSCVSGGIP